MDLRDVSQSNCTSISSSGNAQTKHVEKKQAPFKKFTVCSVPTCRKNNRRNPGLYFPKFPSDERRCKRWVKAVGDPDLVHVPIEKLCTLRRVCSNHFNVHDFCGPNGPKGKIRLNSAAIPHIFDPFIEPLSDEVMQNFVGYASQRSAQKSIHQVMSSISPLRFPCNSTDQSKTVILSHDPSSSGSGLTPQMNAPSGLESTTFGISINETCNVDGIILAEDCLTSHDRFSNIRPIHVSKGNLNSVSSSSATVNKNGSEAIPYPLQVYPMRLQPGQEITFFLKNFVTVNGIKAAFILTCVGSVRSVDLRFATSSIGELKISKIRENLEICSLVGTVCQDGLHLHGTFGNSNGHTISGHVMGNMIVETTAEIMLGKAIGAHFCREYDHATGFKELAVHNSIPEKIESNKSHY